MDDWQIESYLGLGSIGIARLALCQHPRPDHEDEDIAAIAAITGCEKEKLRRLFTDEAQVIEEAMPRDRTAQRPFRLDSDEEAPF